jgi:hypothetical protein
MNKSGIESLISQTKWGSVLMAAFTAGQTQYIAMTQVDANHNAALIASVMTAISTGIAGVYNSSKGQKKEVSQETDLVSIVSVAASTVVPAGVQQMAPELVKNIAKEAERVFRRGIKL